MNNSFDLAMISVKSTQHNYTTTITTAFAVAVVAFIRARGTLTFSFFPFFRVKIAETQQQKANVGNGNFDKVAILQENNSSEDRIY